MQQNNGEGRQATRRHAPTGQRFWYIVLAGTLVTLSYDLMPLLRGQLSPLLKLIVPGLLLAGLYRGSEWARWLLMISLLGFGVPVMYLTTSLMPYSIDIWLHRFVCSAAMVATGLYMALARKDFARYCNYVALRDGPKAAARRRAAEQANRQNSAR
ncbi:hypothetical protein [Achromobacter xylosoxidans]|uniref:hypothetical protein n=1 Tax=Alcaligenes xylosoxydans xylosoxydans TaxID=85698 RepID=UPI0006BF4A92|nr:hypothetical protein [Achromobacter xylosoxidans]MCH4572416.1 hypothetical protein [Achromobacter xylosoxidans]MDD7988842.1 hypothetical protein [Achromobacter xylosoxidans]NEV04580.1 hypothetical protein [Achromobacter xylosoxidans]OFO67585.1 hypothetical protein HMPREF3024_16090 [Achromobacter xylosoxidans]OMG82229.1 hypothetical protein BIZ53_08570 [Achromobacter xylosoxidans]